MGYVSLAVVIKGSTFCTPRPLDARVVDVDGSAQGPDSEARPVRPPAQRRNGVHVLHVADPGFFPSPRPRCMY